MNKLFLLIALALATTLGTGIYLYTKSKPAPTDEEMTPASLAQQAPEREAPVPAETPEIETDVSNPNPSIKQPQAKAKAASGHFEMSRPARHDAADSSDHPGFGKPREKRLWEIFKSDPDLVASVKVNKIHCRVDTCIVDAESLDGNAERFQSLMFALTKQYPWIGNKIDVTTPDGDPLVARYVYFHEIPK